MQLNLCLQAQPLLKPSVVRYRRGPPDFTGTATLHTTPLAFSCNPTLSFPILKMLRGTQPVPPPQPIQCPPPPRPYNLHPHPQALVSAVAQQGLTRQALPISSHPAGLTVAFCPTAATPTAATHLSAPA